jgi:hypothetical protein
VPEQELQLRLAVLRRAVAHEFHLAEFVHAQHATRVLPRRPRLAAEARAVGGETTREVGRGEDLVAVEIGDRHLGVGIRKRSSSSSRYMSSANFGSCVVPVIVARFTTAGTQSSS